MGTGISQHVGQGKLSRLLQIQLPGDTDKVIRHRRRMTIADIIDLSRTAAPCSAKTGLRQVSNMNPVAPRRLCRKHDRKTLPQPFAWQAVWTIDSCHPQDHILDVVHGGPLAQLPFGGKPPATTVVLWLRRSRLINPLPVAIAIYTGSTYQNEAPRQMSGINGVKKIFQTLITGPARLRRNEIVDHSVVQFHLVDGSAVIQVRAHDVPAVPGQLPRTGVTSDQHCDRSAKVAFGSCHAQSRLSATNYKNV